MSALAAALGLAAARAAFEMRLVDQYGAVMDGSVSQTGRLEVRNPPSSTTWGTVCDDYWNYYERNADVACDELGTAAVSYDDYAPTARALSAVSVLHLKGAAQALVTRSDLTGPVNLRGKILWTPYVSTTHYILLAAMSQMGIDVSDLTLETRSPAAIVAAWDAGTIDGAACWGNTMAYLLDNPHGATQGGKSVRNSQLQRLLSRPFPTRFG
ncbi:platelet-activating factor acetyltransferase [Aureococcus anophagefferens]|nr:platelet-activating factor acetyltransferase [Aureococcus anophagefferens]